LVVLRVVGGVARGWLVGYWGLRRVAGSPGGGGGRVVWLLGGVHLEMGVVLHVRVFLFDMFESWVRVLFQVVEMFFEELEEAFFCKRLGKDISHSCRGLA
jgi:hypothetical protein